MLLKAFQSISACVPRLVAVELWNSCRAMRRDRCASTLAPTLNQTWTTCWRSAGRVGAGLVMACVMAPSSPCEESPSVVLPVWWLVWFCPSVWVSYRVVPPVMGVRVDSPEASVKKMRFTRDGFGRRHGFIGRYVSMVRPVVGWPTRVLGCRMRLAYTPSPFGDDALCAGGHGYEFFLLLPLCEVGVGVEVQVSACENLR